MDADMEASSGAAGSGGGDQPSADQTDARGLRLANPAASSNLVRSPLSSMRTGEDESKYIYKMDHKRRGLCIIINNKKFDKNTGMGERSGSDVDAATLYQRFKELGFETHLFNNQKAQDMMKILLEASKHDHNDVDCFACVILSHGDQGIVYGTDVTVDIEVLVEPFKGDKCPQLAGKPKLFFIQACRGTKLDHGTVVADSIEDEMEKSKIPTEADFLFAYSTTPGFFSWRNSTKGSWFVQGLSRALQSYGHMEIMRLLTRVNRMVAYEFESNASQEFMNKKKQIPSIVSMLTKELYLQPTRSTQA